MIASTKPFSIAPIRVRFGSDSKIVSKGTPVRATWSGLSRASKNDWVGLFPRGGPRQSGLAMVATGGKPDGVVNLTVPGDILPGDYELRFYAAGGWTLLATSPLKVVEARGQFPGSPR